MECKVCLELYDQCERRPRVLPCGHTFCAECIEDLFSKGTLRCPNCRADHAADKPSQFPYAFELEELIQRMAKMAKMSRKEEEEEEEGDKEEGRRRKRKINNSLRQQLESSLRLATDCEEMLPKLERMCTYYHDFLESHQRHIDAQKYLIEVQETERDALRQNKDRLSFLQRQGRLNREEISPLLAVLEGDLAEDEEEVSGAMAESKKSFEAMQDWLLECRREVSDYQCTAAKSITVIEDTRKALENLSQEMSKSTIQILLPNSISTVETPLRQLMESGQVVGVQERGGSPRYARVTMDDDAICLHHLDAHPPVASHTTMSHEALFSRVNLTSALTFIDLHWPTLPASRRVYIRIDPEGDPAQGRQFALMCCAYKGPSYANTKLSGVWCRGEDSEFLTGGDYDGKGGVPIVGGISDKEIVLPWKEGVVAGGYNRTTGFKNTMFRINTRTCKGKSYYGIPFGRVERGLDVVRAAARVDDIRSVTIVDCGVVVQM